MLSFSKQVFSGGRALEFYFDRISTARGYKYHISVKGSFQTHHFTMEKRGENWHILRAPAPEQWILALEKKLEEAILNHEATG
jgi:hypothetical protein